MKELKKIKEEIEAKEKELCNLSTELGCLRKNIDFLEQNFDKLYERYQEEKVSYADIWVKVEGICVKNDFWMEMHKEIDKFEFWERGFKIIFNLKKSIEQDQLSGKLMLDMKDGNTAVFWICEPGKIERKIERYENYITPLFILQKIIPFIKELDMLIKENRKNRPKLKEIECL